jgi:NodT family efflux transporter outer membrane factor (OMF) lipoprotein
MVGPDYVRPEAEVNPSWLESNRLQAERHQEIVAKRARLAAVERKIAGIVAAIEDGNYNRSLTERLGVLESEQEVLEEELAQIPALQEEPAEIREWWTAFDDPVLTRLVHEAYEQNLSLRAAGLRVIQARAIRGIAVGEFFPQEQGISANYSKNQISKNDLNNPPFDNFQTAGLSFDATWELDFWGKFRRNIRAQDAALLASIADYDDVLVTLVAEVGLTYVQIRTFEQRIELATANVGLQRQSLEITESRYRNGKVSQLDITEARATLTNTQSIVPDLESSLRDAKLSLCVLLSRTPSELEEELAGGSGIPMAPAEVAIAVPADLLRRRPDVRSAERAAAFQSEQIGVAIADLFPSISISGSAGYEASNAGNKSLSLNNLFAGNSFVGSIGPTLSWPVLNYGRIRNNIRVQDAAFQESAINYQNTVLQAAAEVESALYGFLKAQEQLAYLTESAESVRQSLYLSTIQYKEGETDFLRVDIAAGKLAQQQDSQATVEGLVASNLIGAYKALGGGWELRLGREFIPEAMIKEMRSRTNWGTILAAPDYSSTTDLGFERPKDTDETYLGPQTEPGREQEGGK